MKRWTPRGARAPRGGGTEASAASVTSARRVFRMNCEIHQLAPLRCEAFQAKETLRAVLHTILFARTLGVVRARDVDSELFDLTYTTCGDPAVERHVEERLDALVRWLAPGLLGLPVDLQIVQLREEVAPFYETVFAETGDPRELVRDPHTIVRGQPLAPDIGPRAEKLATLCVLLVIAATARPLQHEMLLRVLDDVLPAATRSACSCVSAAS